MSDYADPDLETLAPWPPPPPPRSPVGSPAPPSPSGGRGPILAVVAALVVVSLVVGFGVATLVLNARDSSADQSAPTTPTTPATLIPGTSPSTLLPGSVPGSTAPGRVPADPHDASLGSVVLRQADVSSAYTVALRTDGATTAVATLDLCNGTFPSEKLRTARRQVDLVDGADNTVMSTEAVLYGAPSGGAQAFRELQSVRAHCPSIPVTSPVGEGTAITRFRAAPDAAWPHVAAVDRLAYDFDTASVTTGDSAHAIAVYLRRGRALMGVYFDNPDGPQVAVAGQTTVGGIVGVFEARLAALPAAIVNG